MDEAARCRRAARDAVADIEPAALRDALADAGVRVTTGDPVVEFDAKDGRVKGVQVDREGRLVPFSADAFVLATGGRVGKGIDSDRESVREPLFDCHVPHSNERYDWFADDAFGDHPFARFGVVTDDDLRPLDREGDAEFPNLRAAGAVEAALGPGPVPEGSTTAREVSE